MKMILRFFSWIIAKWHLLLRRKPEANEPKISKPSFQIRYSEDIPETISESDIFIVQDGNEPDLLLFKCPCGCNADVMLNLLRDASPRWGFNLNEHGEISIHPSVWRTTGCKSHFFVTDSDIKWV